MPPLPPPEQRALLRHHAEKNDARRSTLFNFISFSVLFAANPCCVLACMALATARLGTMGAYQTGIIYAFYTLSSIAGATLVVKECGAKQSIVAGMLLYCLYVACFIVATSIPAVATPCALMGAALGGSGGGLLWTAQGVYFSQAASAYALENKKKNHKSDATSYLAAIFACIYLAMEALLELLPTILMDAGIASWTSIFGIYSIIALTATLGMLGVQDYPISEESNSTIQSIWDKILASWYLLKRDDKMKYLMGVNAAFGFSGAFVHSLVNGEIVRIVLRDYESKYVGALSAWSAIVSSIMSLVFVSLLRKEGLVQILGCLAYLCVALPFLLLPNLQQQWGWGLLIFVYFMYGCGRATFEGSLKAILANWFPHEKEGAYGNLVLQSGITSTLGFIVTYCGLSCSTENTSYCIEYNNGTRHNILPLELAVAVTSVLAIFGCLKAAQLFEEEQRRDARINLTT